MISDSFKRRIFLIVIIVSATTLSSIFFPPLTTIKRPVSESSLTFGTYGFESFYSKDNNELVELKYPMNITFSNVSTGANYDINVHIKFTGFYMPIGIEFTFSISGLVSKSVISIEDGSEIITNTIQYWDFLPDDFIYIDESTDNNPLISYKGIHSDNEGNWTYFGKLNYLDSAPIRGDSKIFIKTNFTYANEFFNGKKDNLSASSFTFVQVRQFKFRIAFKWENKIMGIFPITSNNAELIIGDGRDISDWKAIYLTQAD
ncbi:MAG: hypothetical protein HeimC3_14100 [Candidatus Heimdallarchaeota archaeon LC_3]|nr:MAG: hypothetical protein HeimC3_14100 [Candidatus Heimdallarchaeota archaeon LC_3]